MVKEIIFAISASGIAIAALAWLAKKIVTHFLSKDIEAYKVKLEAGSEMEIEKLRNSLRQIAYEHGINKMVEGSRGRSPHQSVFIRVYPWLKHWPMRQKDFDTSSGLATFSPVEAEKAFACAARTLVKFAGSKIMSTKKQLSSKRREELLKALKARFERNLTRHRGLDWAKVQARLEANPEKLWSLNEMESTGGEPDVVGYGKKSGEFIFLDCSAQTPRGRVSVCYDREGLEARKVHKPKTTAMDMAAAMGVELLTEEEYFTLQKLGEFDTKTSSWIATPAAIRKPGGALYAERRYGRIFVGHNGAQSYYAVRGFRGSLRV